MRLYFLFPFLAVLAILQTTVIARWSFEAKPDLILVAVIAWGATSTARNAYWWGLVGGMWLDLLSGLPFGIQTIALAAMGVLANSLETVFFRTNVLVPLATIFIATILYHAIELGLLQIIGRPVDWTILTTRVILPSALVNTALMPFVYGAFGWLNRRDRSELSV